MAGQKLVNPNKTVSKFRSVIYASAIIGVVSAVLFTIIYFISFDADSHYFNDDGIVILAFAFIAAAVIACCVVSAVLPKLTTPIEGFTDGRRYASISAIAGISIHLVLLVKMVLKIFTSKSARPEIGALAGLIVVLCSAVYYVLTFLGKNGYNTVWLGFFAALQPILIIADTYFDNTVEMNSPEKVGIEMAMASIMLFTTVELRFMLNRPMPRTSLALTCISFVVCCYAFIPNIIAHLAGFLNNSTYLFYNFVGLCFTVYIGWRMFNLARAIKYVTEEAPNTEGGNV